MTQLYGIKLCLYAIGDDNVNCSSELNWVMVDVLNYMCVIVVD